MTSDTKRAGGKMESRVQMVLYTHSNFPIMEDGIRLFPIFMRVDRPTDGSPLIIPTQVQGG